MKKIAAKEWVYEWPTPAEQAEFEELLRVNQMMALAFSSLNRRAKAAFKKMEP